MITHRCSKHNFIAIWRGGITWRAAEHRVFCFRTPLSKPLFSERNGYHRHYHKLLGFRVWVSK